MNDKVVIIVQARLGSTRLPGKILKPLNGYPVLQHVLERCAAVLGRDKVICAGVDKPGEEPVRELVESMGIDYFAGDELDVLSRYYLAARQRGAEWVVRVTSDCPLLDASVCRGLIEHTLGSGADFGITEGWPHGLDCEVMTFDVLERAWQHARSATDREHVTLWIKRNQTFRQVAYSPAEPIGNLHQYRWVVDYPEDLQLLEQLFSEMDIKPADPVGYLEIVHYLDKHQSLLLINKRRIEEWAFLQGKIMGIDDRGEQGRS